MTEKECLYWLSCVPGIGAVSIRRLRESLGSLTEVWNADKKKLMETKALTEKKAEAILFTRREEAKYRRECEKTDRQGIVFTAFWEKEYPKRLRFFEDSPAALFLKGRFPEEDAPTAAIVGARGCTEYGRQTAGYFASELAKEGVQIISGLAQGIDGAAHKGALEAGFPSYAVLGCGVNVCYPRENYSLFGAMEENGGILSELVPGTKPSPMNFPMRNRIISALSDAVMIIEAREKSGSLITAGYALEQGKEIFALPGRISDPLSIGCNQLIQNGAAILTAPADVLEFFQIKYERKLTLHKISEKRLAKKENLVYSCLDSRPKHLDEIIAGSGLPVTECIECLFRLELGGLILETGNQYYCRKM